MSEPARTEHREDIRHLEKAKAVPGAPLFPGSRSRPNSASYRSTEKKVDTTGGRNNAHQHSGRGMTPRAEVRFFRDGTAGSLWERSS